MKPTSLHSHELQKRCVSIRHPFLGRYLLNWANVLASVRHG